LIAGLLLQCAFDDTDDAAPAVSGPSRILCLGNANLVDVQAGVIQEKVDILIEGMFIRHIHAHGRKLNTKPARCIDLEGRFVIPGLIEGHTHITPLPEACLTVALRKGVVAIREMAGDGEYIAMLRKAINEGDLAGPDIYFSAVLGGRDLIMKDSRIMLVTPPTYSLGSAPWARLVTAESDIVKIISDAKGCGATGIKLYAHLSADLIRKLSDEAKEQGLKVWAHMVTYPATAEETAGAGVEVLSHAAFFLLPPDWHFKDGSQAMHPSNLDDARIERLLKIMKTNHTVLDPTLTVVDSMLAAVKDKEKIYKLKQAVYDGTRKAFENGIPLIAGTDEYLPRTMADPLPLLRELELLVTEVGLTPLEALRTATMNTARVLGISDRLGTLEPGKLAHLVVLNKNPLKDIGALKEIEFVMKNGWVVN
jgi:imidazolonepropionase-like amidohydrolase